MTKEQKFYKALQDVFIGAKIEGKGGFVNLMRIKSNYYRKIEERLKQDIDEALQRYPAFRDELFDKLYSFFSRYFTESGSIYFNSTPFHNNIYEKVYTDEKDVILFWKTHMLYYVKTDRIFRSLPVEFPSDRGVDAEGGRGVYSPLQKGCPEGTGYLKFYFDASKIESKKANEKRSLVFDLKEIREDGTIVFNVSYSERGTKTKQDNILKAIKRKGITITEEQLERAFRVFEKQSEVDFFINKNAKAFLQEQFKLWSYQYFWEGAKEWSADRVNQLQILKDIAFKIIEFISQFEDELVKIWNKPKFVKNSNYVITLDRIKNIELIEKILKHKGIKEQIKEWQELGIVDENFKVENSPFLKGWQSEGLTGYLKLPYNPALKQKARELRKAGNLSEVLLWNELKQKKIFGLDFTRQQIIGNYIVDFYCPKLNLIIEIDGQSHDFKGEYDARRDEFLKSLGLNILHFQDKDVKRNLSGVIEIIKNWIKKNTPSASQPPLLLKGEFEHLPIDTKYFKDLELEILSQFEDLDKSLDGWLIKSENYQALNTILPKFKEKVQCIYIDPPFNTGSDFAYVDKFQDSTWLSLMNDRIDLAKKFLRDDGSFYLHLDRKANYLGRFLMENIFSYYKNEIIWKYFVSGKYPNEFAKDHDLIMVYSNIEKNLFNYNKERDEDLYMKKKNNNDIIIGEDGIEYYKYNGELRTFEKQITETWNIDKVKRDGNEILGFDTQKPEKLLKRILLASSNNNSLILDFFLGSGTTTAVAHKLGRKWIGIEMGEHFYSVVLPRMKKVLAYDKSGISKEVKDYQGGGFFKYYELEQYEEALANCKYEDGDLFTVPNRSPYQEYVFMKDEKMLKALEIDYEQNKVKVNLSKLYPNIDIAETLSNLTGKWIKKISDGEVEFEDGTKINTKDLDYKLIKSLIWW